MRIAFSGEIEGTAEEIKQAINTIRLVRGVVSIKANLPDDKPQAPITIDKNSLPPGSSTSVSPSVREFVDMAPLKRSTGNTGDTGGAQHPNDPKVITRVTKAKPTQVFAFKDSVTGAIVDKPHQTVKPLNVAVQMMIAKAAKLTTEGWLLNEAMNGRPILIKPLGKFETQDEAAIRVLAFEREYRKKGGKYILDSPAIQLDLFEIQYEDEDKD